MQQILTVCATEPHAHAVSYAVNRNINYTNICGYACQFCAFRWV